jgi:hypothetical protein
MITPPMYLISPLVCPGVHVCPIFRVYISYGSTRLITVPHPYQITEKEKYAIFLEYMKYRLIIRMAYYNGESVNVFWDERLNKATHSVSF